jgi:uncharacterized protein YutE (UPF0331/DUF86 family)
MADEELRPEDAARIADAVESIERTVTRLRSVQSLSRAAYGGQENVETREAVERRFETLAAATIDVAETICRIERGHVPDSRKAAITALEDDGVLGADLARRLREAVGFRDVLAHAYGPVVNDDIVYDALQNSLDRYVEFVDAIRQYMEAA